MTDFPHLFDPIRIGSLDLPNRVVRASMSTSLGNPDGTISERALRFYGRLAAGRTGLIMSEYAYIDELVSKGAHGQFGISNDEHIAGLNRLAGTIQAHGVRAGIQIVHTGRQSETAMVPKAPSPVRWEHGAEPEELTVEEIDDIVEAFGEAARRGWLAGFDLVELHVAHGYLLTEFLSPHTNRRSDEYGGSFANRRRVVERAMDAVRGAVPDDFPITVRVSCSDYRDRGITVEETIGLCQILEQKGAAAVHVSGGDHSTGHMQWSPMPIGPAPHASYSLRIRQALSIPVILSGSIGTPHRAEQLLNEGVADLVALARPLLADPDWTRKAAAGRSDDIRPCIRCNDGCVERSALLSRSTTCSVNPFVENDLVLGLSAAILTRRIAVVGGGPAGMVASIVLAKRGHEVTMFERHQLGGALHAATRDDFKSDLRSYMEYLVRRVRASKVQLLVEAATPETLAGGDFEVVILASGARRDGGDLFARGVRDVLSVTPDEAVDQRVVVVGADYAAVETSLRLATAGASQVTMISTGDRVLPDAEEMERRGYEILLDSSGVELRLGSEIVEIDANSLTLAGARLQASIVAVSPASAPENAVSVGLADADAELYAVGDALSPGKVHDAVHSAYKLARRI